MHDMITNDMIPYIYTYTYGLEWLQKEIFQKTMTLVGMRFRRKHALKNINIRRCPKRVTGF